MFHSKCNPLQPRLRSALINIFLFQGVEFNGLVPGHVFGKFDYSETEPVVRSIPRLPYGDQSSLRGPSLRPDYSDYSAWGPASSFPYKRDTSHQAKKQKSDYLPSEAQSSKYQSDGASREYKDENISALNKNFKQSDFQKIEETFTNNFPTFDSF